MTDFEERSIRQLGIKIKEVVQINERKEKKRKIILDQFHNDGDIQLLAEFLSWFDE